MKPGDVTLRDPGTDLLRLAPYVEVIVGACREAGEDPFLLAGIGMRETRFGWCRGYYVVPGRPRWDGWGDDADGPNGPRRAQGYGIWQIDRRSHPDFCSRSRTPEEQARYALQVLADGRSWLHRHLPELGPEDLLHAALSSYNAGAGTVFHALVEGRSCDAPTTGKDYGLDVLRRADVLRRESPALFGPDAAPLAQALLVEARARVERLTSTPQSTEHA